PMLLKTYLYLEALGRANNEQKESLLHYYGPNKMTNDYKVKLVKELFVATKSDVATREKIKDYTNKAFSVLESLSISEEKKGVLKQFGEQLMNRTH
ncbi:MAG: polyprenyl synthetase family protein, partial [Flavobacteriaceae bacterium]|nr:polyprenyl synthetase family protein [Flavobacteriaceae bacterium]